MSNYKNGALTGETIVRSVPQLEQVADVKVEQIVNVASYDLTLDNWLTLSKRINEFLKQDDVDGSSSPTGPTRSRRRHISSTSL